MMKKKALVSVLMASAMAMSLAACGGSSSSSSNSGSAAGTSSASAASETATETAASTADTSSSSASTAKFGSYKVDDSKNYKFSMIMKTLSSEHWQVMQAGAKKYMEEHPNVQVDITGPSAETMYDEQMNSITTALATEEYDGYIIAPLQSDSVASMISNVTKPVIAVDTNMKSDALTTFVGTGNEEAAKEGMTKAVAKAKELGWDEINVIEIAGVQGDETNTARMNGYKAGAEENGATFMDDETQYANAVADLAVTAMEGIMSKYPDGVAIICANNDDMALAAAKAAKDNPGYKNTVFLGFDGSSAVCKAIADGEVSNFMTIAQNPYEMGYESVEAAVEAVDGVKLPSFIDSGVTIIDESNAADRYQTVTGYLK